MFSQYLYFFVYIGGLLNKGCLCFSICSFYYFLNHDPTRSHQLYLETQPLYKCKCETNLSKKLTFLSVDPDYT